MMPIRDTLRGGIYVWRSGSHRLNTRVLLLLSVARILLNAAVATEYKSINWINRENLLRIVIVDVCPGSQLIANIGCGQARKIVRNVL